MSGNTVQSFMNKRLHKFSDVLKYRQMFCTLSINFIRLYDVVGLRVENWY